VLEWCVWVLRVWLSGSFGGGLYAWIYCGSGVVSDLSLLLTTVTATNNRAGRMLYSVQPAVRVCCDTASLLNRHRHVLVACNGLQAQSQVTPPPRTADIERVLCYCDIIVCIFAYQSDVQVDMCRRLRSACSTFCVPCASGYIGGGLSIQISGHNVSNASLLVTAVTAVNNTASKTLSPAQAGVHGSCEACDAILLFALRSCSCFLCCATRTGRAAFWCGEPQAPSFQLRATIILKRFCCLVCCDVAE
jgi:hypothetical protein